MNKTSALRIAIILEWFSFTLLIFTIVIFEEFLPVALREYLHWEETQGYSGFQKILAAAYMISLIICIISSIFIFFLKKPAKWVYLICTALALLIEALMADPLVLHFIPGLLYGIGTLLTGFILALIFFTDVLDVNQTSSDGSELASSQSPPPMPLDS